MQSEESLLFEFDKVSRIYGHKGEETLALDDASFSIREGTSLGIVGESGAGKSTILKLAVGLDQPSSGKIFWNGENLLRLNSRQKQDFRRHVQMVFQDPLTSLNPRLTVEKIISEPLRSLKIGGNHQHRVSEVLESVGLDASMASRYPAHFSGGQRQRIAIARALAPNPGLIIADEPVSALDVSVKAQLIDLLAELKSNLALTLLMVSHDISVVGLLCEEMLVMHKGKVVEQGATQSVLSEPSDEYTKKLLAAVPVLPE